MEKNLPSCEHTAVMPCGQDPSVYSCLARCDRIMECCSKICRFRCHECQNENEKQEDGKVIRTQHRLHPCEKRLHCSHPCREKCSSSHEHTKRCMEDCRQSCGHAKCQSRCSEPCAPCQEPCGWSATLFSINYISFLISFQELRPLLLSCPMWFGQLKQYLRLLSVINLNPIDMCTVAVRQTVQEISKVWPSMPIWCVIYQRDDSI